MGIGHDLSEWISRREADLEARLVRAMTRGLGIQWAVRYFRNPNPKITVSLLRALGAQIGEGTRIKGSLLFDNTHEDANSTYDFSHLSIGRNCYLGDGVFIDLANNVTLGDNVVVSGQAAFITHSDCHRSEFLNRHFPRVCEPVRIDDGAWIGFRATILCGVTVAENSLIAAHSILRESTKPNALYAGSPAAEVRTLSGTGR